MTVLKATAYLNALTKEVDDDYYLILQITGTLDLAGIIKRLRDKEIATKNVNGESFVNTVFKEMAQANAEGYNIVTPYFRSSPGLNAVVKAEDLGHPLSPERTNAKINFSQGEDARKAAATISVYVNEQSAASGPVIQSVYDPTNNIPNTLYTGGMVLIQGMRMSLKGEDASVGITFVKAEDDDDRPVIESEEGNAIQVGEEVFVRPKEVYPNTPSNLQFILPSEITPGNWNVKITTQASSASNVTTKSPRTYQFEKTIKVDTRKM